MKKLLLLILVALFIASCQPPQEGSNDVTFTGSIKDGVTGSPVPGVTVYLNNHSTTTNASGAYTLSIPRSETIGTFYCFRPNFYFYYYNNVTIDFANTVIPDFYLTKIDLAAYTPKTISGTVKFDDGSDVPDTGTVRIYARNRGAQNGIYSQVNIDAGGGTYSASVWADAQDSLVYAIVTPNDGTNDPFMVWLNCDLSGDSPVTVNLQESATPPSSLDIEFPQTNNMCSGILQTDYGVMQLFMLYGTASPRSLIQYLTAGDLTESVLIDNPMGFSCAFQHMQPDTVFNGNYPGHEKYYVATSDLLSVSSPYSLPAIDSVMGPDEPADGGSLDYTGGVLSYDAAPNSTVTNFTIVREVDSAQVGQMLVSGNSVTLPEPLRNFLYGQVNTVGFQVIDADYIFKTSNIAFAAFPLNLQAGMIQSDSYVKTIIF